MSGHRQCPTCEGSGWVDVDGRGDPCPNGTPDGCTCWFDEAGWQTSMLCPIHVETVDTGGRL